MKERDITEQNFENSAIEEMGEENQEEVGVRLTCFFESRSTGAKQYHHHRKF